MTAGVSESSWSDKTSKPGTTSTRRKSCSTGSNSTPSPPTESSNGTHQRKENRPNFVNKKMGQQYVEPTNIPFLGPLKPINPRTYPSIYESMKRTLKGKKGIEVNRSFHVYKRFLDLLFDYPLKNRHAKCINALLPCYTCCIDEACPTCIFLTVPIKMKPLPFQKPKSRRQSFMESLERKLRTLRDGLLHKLNLARPQ